MTGAHEHSLDSAGRLIVPAKLRDKIGPHFFLAPGTRGNITVYTEDGWNDLKAKVAAMPVADREEMDFFFAMAQECEVDKQWRFPISSILKEYAGIERDVVTTGNNDLAQIWNAKMWAEKKQQGMNPANIAALMSRMRV